MKCKVCTRKAQNDYCELHEKAYSNVMETFQTWERAATISWEQYLKALVENPFTGIWAKEVAEQLLKIKE